MGGKTRCRGQAEAERRATLESHDSHQPQDPASLVPIGLGPSTSLNSPCQPRLLLVASPTTVPRPNQLQIHRL